jgi:hypothetical protein
MKAGLKFTRCGTSFAGHNNRGNIAVDALRLGYTVYRVGLYAPVGKTFLIISQGCDHDTHAANPFLPDTRGNFIRQGNSSARWFCYKLITKAHVAGPLDNSTLL